MDNDILNEYTDESLEEWEEDGGLDTWEAAFIRGAQSAYDDEEVGEEEL